MPMYTQNSNVPKLQIPIPGPFPYYFNSESAMPLSYPWVSELPPYNPQPPSGPGSHQMFHPSSFYHPLHVPMPQDIPLHPPLHYNELFIPPHIDLPPPRPYLHDVPVKSCKKNGSKKVNGGQDLKTLPIKKRKLDEDEEPEAIYPISPLQQPNMKPEDRKVNYPSTLMYSIAEILSDVERTNRAEIAIQAHMKHLKAMQNTTDFATFARAANAARRLARRMPIFPQYNPMAHLLSARIPSDKIPYDRQQKLARMAFESQFHRYMKPEENRSNPIYTGERASAPIYAPTSVIVEPRARRPN